MNSPSPPLTGHAAPDLRASRVLLAACTLAWLVQTLWPATTLSFAPREFLPLHTTLEMLSLLLSAMAFALLWRVPSGSRRVGLTVLAATLGGSAVLDYLHLMSYAGMPELVTPASPDKAIHFWLLGRAWMVAGFLAVAWLPLDAAPAGRRHVAWLAASLGGVTAAALVVLIRPQWLPGMFVPGQGLSTLKVAAEWGLIGLLAAAGVRLALLGRRNRLLPLRQLASAAAFAAVGELCFGSYRSVTDSLNLLGHLCKLAAYWQLLHAAYQLVVRQPLQETGSIAGALQATLNPSLICDDQGIVRWVNRAFETTSGYLAAEAVGRALDELAADPADDASRQMREAIVAGQAWQGHALVRRRDGSTYLDDRSITPIRDAAGRLNGFIVVGDDATDRARREQQERESAERLQVLLQSAPDGVLVIDERGVIQIANAQVERLFGYSHEDLIGANVRMLMPPDTAAAHDGHLSRYAAGGQRHIIGSGRDVIARRRDGSPLHVHLTVGEARLPTGRAYIGFIRDITDRIRAAEELAQREMRYRTLMDTAADGIWIVDAEGRLIAVNDMYAQQSGYTREELLRMRVPDLEARENSAEVKAHIQRIVELGRDVFETEHRAKDGRIWPVEVSATYWPDAQGQFFVFLRDLTERRAAEQALRRSEQRFALALRGANDGLWDRNLAEDTVYYSPRWKEMLGYADDELPDNRETFDRLLHPDDALRVQLVFGETLAGTYSDRFEVEMRLRHKKGHWVHVLSRAQLVRDDSGRPTRLIGTHQDLSERRAAEKALRENEDKLRRLFELSPVGIALCTFSGEVVEFNEAYLRLTGYGPAELLGLTYWDLTPIEYLAAERQQIDQLTRTGRYGPYEKEYRRADGTLVPVRLNGVRLDIEGRPHIWSIVEDLTETRRMDNERQELQRRQMQSQKLEALGHLTGGIAHDFNNMLAGIMGLASLGLERHVSDPGSKLATYLREIVRTSERGRDLVARMLSFARTEQPVPTQARDIGPLVVDLREMLATSLPSGITLRFDVAPRLPAVAIASADVQQVLMNLVINARDAIGEQGHIQVRLRRQLLDRHTCAGCSLTASGLHVVLEVQDDGLGIPPEVMPRIFDPFFTTKGIGKGTGLGLPSVLGIVHDAGGHVQVEGAPGGGTLFRVMLPAADAPGSDAVAAEAGHAAPASPAARPAALVWVVDDDAAVLVYLTELLKEHGYAVRAFGDPQQALRTLQDDRLPPAALITDQTMPGLSGSELAARALQQFPALPVILCTGYSEQIDPERAAGLGVRHFLRKPFDSRQLLDALAAEIQPATA